MQRLELFAAPLDGFNLVEASAGTGKTYALSGLYLRLVVEADCPVHRILVVTYTKAATEELRDRIRRRLVASRAAFLRGRTDDEFCLRLLDRCAELRLDREVISRRLTNAVRGFDEAAIFTIHGFCQRVLADNAFESGMPFETELVADEREILREVVEDFWRREFYNASPLLVNHLLDEGYSPESFLRDIRAHVGKPYLHVMGPGEPPDFAGAETAFAEAFATARTLWAANRQDVEGLLLGTNDLKGNLYPPKSIPGWLGLMDEYFATQSPGVTLFDRFEKFSSRHMEKAVKKGGKPLVHPFFEACQVLWDAHQRLWEHYRWYLVDVRARLLAFCRGELETRKAQQSLQSYDDLLIGLQRGLRGARGEHLAGALRKRYTAALIDEFQDTDPVQYDIFRRIYADSGAPVFLVGDPKQAIYSFRGADVFAYLTARRDTPRRYTLDENWRSNPRLIDALNALFQRAPQPFLFEDIPFQEAVAATKDEVSLSVEGKTPASLRMWFLADDGNTKAQATEQAARATAVEIARLLDLGARGQARLGARPLAGGDIAVLVRSHHQGRAVRRELLRRGVPSVQQAQDNVFASREALDMEWLLMALAEPGSESRVKAALATALLGATGNELHRFGDDEDAWERWLETFHAYHHQWREHGFMRMFRALAAAEGLSSRLLALQDGERRLTNILHLSELLHTAQTQLHLGMTGLIKWLAEHRHSEDSRDEEHQLRLESDEHLVKIVTVYKSKGLEYPVVFCPFLWDGKLWSAVKDSAISFHDPADPARVFLDIGSTQREERRPWACREELAENLRLLYVALTRAKSCCYLVWGDIKQAGTSAPAWLLHPPTVVGPRKDRLTATEERYDEMTVEALRAEVDVFARRAPDAIHVETLPQNEGAPYQPPLAAPSTNFVARRFTGSIRGKWRISSFTALIGGHEAELPDYDLEPPQEENEADAAEAERTIFTFPRGARAGSCLHSILERLDFSQRTPESLENLVKQTLEAHGFDAEWTPTVAAMVERVLAAPLTPEGLGLAGVPLARRLTELEFYYPLGGLTPAGLRETLAPFDPAYPLERLDFAFARGYMKGFIDLVFEADGRFYLVDYKSNWLGARAEHYHRQRLADTMAREAYYFQYLIYTVAVHRYLKLRLGDYAYDRHMGGVFYLFLRGIDPARGPYGIFEDRPSRALIEALDRYLDSGKH